MIALLALVPCAVVAVAVMVMRWSGLTSAILAFVCALVIWASGVFSPVQIEQLNRAVLDALILELLVGAVIFLGLLFVETISRGGGLGALADAIETLSLAPPRVAILIAVGIGVMLESLTGYGVSMLVTVPLLLRITSRGRAFFLALVGMSLMSWGALSIAALLGAEIAGLPQETLAAEILKTSGPIAFVLPIFCLLAVPSSDLKDVLYAVGAGVALILGIALTSRWIGVEVAGVGGGIAVVMYSLLFSPSRGPFLRALTAPESRPYGLLIAAVVMQKLAVPHVTAIGIAPAIETARVSFHVLGSPAIALATATLLCIPWRRSAKHQKLETTLLGNTALRSWRALAGILFFLLTARLLVETGAVIALADMLSEFGAYAAIASVAMLGGIGSYVTGSGVTSNALFMTSAAATGASFDWVPLFAALQHSGSAHFGIASMPIIAILLAALPHREADDERKAMRLGLGLALIWLLFVITSGTVQFAIS